MKLYTIRRANILESFSALGPYSTKLKTYQMKAIKHNTISTKKLPNTFAGLTGSLLGIFKNYII